MPPPVDLEDLTVAISTTDSNVIDFTTDLAARMASIVIYGPATLPETASVMVAKSSTGNFVTLTSGGADVTVGADKGTPITDIAFCQLKITLSGGAAAERVFKVTGREDH